MRKRLTNDGVPSQMIRSWL